MAPCGVLMVAEKPSIAETVARILSGGNCRKRKGVSGWQTLPQGGCRGRFTTPLLAVPGLARAPFLLSITKHRRSRLAQYSTVLRVLA